MHRCAACSAAQQDGYLGAAGLLFLIQELGQGGMMVRGVRGNNRRTTLDARRAVALQGARRQVYDRCGDNLVRPVTTRRAHP